MPTGKEIIEFIQNNNLENKPMYKIMEAYRKNNTFHKQFKNIIETHSNYAIIKVFNRKTKEYSSILVDIDDIKNLSKHTWRIHDKYPITTINQKNIQMHRFILNYFGNLEVDHINRNKFDNRKNNLRIVTRVENLANNKSKHIYKNGKRYHAVFNRYGIKYDLGYFSSYTDAEKAVQEKLKYIELNKEYLLNNYLAK